MNEENSISKSSSTETNSNRFFIKTLIIGGIALLLLIPLFMTLGIVSERKQLSEQATFDISWKWGGQQNMTTPILMIPLKQKETKEKVPTTYRYVLARELKASARLQVEMRHRSIYEVPIYTAEVNMEGAWYPEDIREAISEAPEDFDLSKAKVGLAVSDPSGFRDLIYLTVAGQKLRLKLDSSTGIGGDILEPNYHGETIEGVANTLTFGGAAHVAPFALEELNQPIPFSCTTTLLGSKKFGFLTTGTSSCIDITANWGNPSFQGRQLPMRHEISEDNFSAHWNNVFTDSFIDYDQLPTLAQNHSYVNLSNPANHYSKTERSVKYGILVIVLTLLSLFLVELSLYKRGITIHVLHYILSGLSLVLFYSLLLSFSEVIGFGLAYLVASIMTIGLNTLYFKSVLRNNKLALLLGGILTLLYIGIYILMQMETYALLAGSIGLFIILSFVMFYSSKMTSSQNSASDN